MADARKVSKMGVLARNLGFEHPSLMAEGHTRSRSGSADSATADEQDAVDWQRPQLGVGPGRRDVRQHTDGFRRGTRSKTDDAVEHAAADDDHRPQRRRLDASGAPLPAVAEHSERIGKVFATAHLSHEGRRQNAAWRKKVDWYLRDGDAAGLHMDLARRFRQQTWAASRGG